MIQRVGWLVTRTRAFLPASAVVLSLASTAGADRLTSPKWLSRPTGVQFADASLTGQFGTIDRRTVVHPAMPDGTPVAPSRFGARYDWSGLDRLRGERSFGGLDVSHAPEYSGAAGRLASLALSTPTVALGSFAYGWDETREVKTSRSVDAGSGSLLGGFSWTWAQDGAMRLSRAVAGSTGGRPRGAWDFGLGRGDELLWSLEVREGRVDYGFGVSGRVTSRSAADGQTSFLYDASGRRIEDSRFTYTYDWRGRLVQADGKPGSGLFEGHRIAYAHDGTGRLLARTELGGIPQGGTDSSRPFIAKRVFLWDGDTLLAESGVNYAGQVIWRHQYVPGPGGLDDAPQVRVETNLQTVAPGLAYYAFLRDEQGSVIGVAEDRGLTAGDWTPLLARYLYTPYGEAHLERGPELLRIAFDPSVTKAGAQSQAPPVPGETVAGALVVQTTVALDPASYGTGVRIEQWDAVALEWQDSPAGEFAIGAGSTPELLAILRLTGWPKGVRYRITLLPVLVDEFSRSIQLPAGETAGVVVGLDVPPDGVMAPAYEREFPFTYDTVAAASDTLCVPGSDGVCTPRFPGGQTSLHAGMWTDPVTGLAYARARWLDTRNGVWLQEDPMEDIDSPNLYASMAWRPHELTDPLGLAVGSMELWAIRRQQGSDGPAAGFDEARLLRQQLAIEAVLANPRVQGGIGLLGGTGEIGVGIAALLNPLAPGVSQIAGGVAIAHGSDVVGTNLAQLITGEAMETKTHQAISSTARWAGASPETAQSIASWSEFGLSLAATSSAAWGATRARVATGVVPENAVEQGRDALGRFLPKTGEELAPGGVRALRVQRRLQGRFGHEAVQQEQYLRLSDGTIALDDMITGEARRLDFVVITEGQARFSVEVTSKTASKFSQLAKERRIRQLGGTFVLDRTTGKIVDLSKVPTRLLRRR